MARETALVPTSLWRDQGFTALGEGAQWTWLMLLTQPELDAGGMLPLRERRWAELAFDATVPVPAIQADLAELEVAGWAYCDETWQEVFVSGFFESQHVHQIPKRAVAARDAIAEARSARLASLAAIELDLLIAGVIPSVPRGLRAEVLDRDGYQCQSCGWRLGDPVPIKQGTTRPLYRTLEIDHVWPRSKGGKDAADNFQVLCTSCNCSKGARTLWAPAKSISR